MKKLRKMCSILIMLSMVMTMFTACGKPTKRTSGTDAPTDNSSAGTKVTGEADEAPYEIVMPFVTVGTTPADLGKVEAAISEYTMQEINCTVKFKPVSITELTTQYNLWTSSGEKVDLLFLFFSDLGSYVNEGKIVKLAELMQYAPTISKESEESPFLSGGYYNNELYAIPVINPAQGEGKAMYARTDLLEEAGYEKKDLYTYEDLDTIFAKIHAAHPDMTVMARAGAITTTYASGFINYDNLGNGSAAAGVLMNVGSDNTKVVNLYETDEYKELLQWQRKWYQAGYISKDAPTTSDNAGDWVKAGRCAGFSIGDDTIGNQANIEASSGYDITQLNIKSTYVTTNTYNQLRWCITTMSERPDKAMQFLDLLYNGEYLVNLIQNGIEGTHWVKTDDAKIIDFPEGINGVNTPFSNPLGIYGDKRNMSMFVPNTPDFYPISEQYTADALTKQSAALGYAFVSDDYTTELAAISSVLSQYLTTLEYGTVDIDSTLPEFISALKNAGIDDVIAANQKQLDEWLAANK
ncbi:MAG TPA: ABC transporter substrate-binding protein [Clostridiales bacterium]|nr:ABC transporter substrate-binding protein [Clostridiales bacterium]